MTMLDSRVGFAHVVTVGDLSADGVRIVQEAANTGEDTLVVDGEGRGLFCLHPLNPTLAAQAAQATGDYRLAEGGQSLLCVLPLDPEAAIGYHRP
jgi:hypothetical protein